MRWIKRFSPLLWIVVVFALAGCASTTVQGTKYTAFKEATAALDTDVRTSYEKAISLWEELNAECLASPGSAADYDDILRTKGIPCGKDTLGNDVRFENPKPRFDARLQALDAMLRYGSLLNTLATTDYAAGVDAAAKVSSSLENLRSALTPAVPQMKELDKAAGVIQLVVQDCGQGLRQR